MKIQLPAIEINTRNLFLFFSILIIPFIYSTSVPDPSLSPRYFGLAAMVLIFVVILLFRLNKTRITNQFFILRNKIFIFYFLYIVFSGISVFFSINVQEAIYEWLKTFSIFLYFILLSVIISNHSQVKEVSARMIIVFGLFISIRGFNEFFNVTEEMKFDHQVSYFIRAFSSNRNLYSQLLFLCLPFLVYGIYRFKPFWKYLSLFTSALSLTLIVILLTRSVWISAVVAIFTGALLLMIFRNRFGLTRRIFQQISAIVFFVFIVIVAVVLINSKNNEEQLFSKQLYWLSDYRFGSSLERVELWQKTVEMITDHPITGVGSGNWRIAFPSYGLKDLRSEGGIIVFQRPHNDFLWVFAENGIIAFISYVMIFLSAFYYLMQTIRKSKFIQDQVFSLLLFSGLMGYLVISMLSFPKERIEHQVFLHLMFAFSITNYTQDLQHMDKFKPGISRLVMILVLVGTTFSFSFALKRVDSERHIQNLYDARVAKQWEEVILQADLSNKPLTSMDAFAAPLDWYKGESLFILDRKEEAFESFRKAYIVNPNNLHVLNNLGTCYEIEGDREKAKTYFKKALAISPRFTESGLNLCAVYFNERELDSAYLAIAPIPDTIDNQRYKHFIETVLRNKMNEIRLQEDDQLISMTIRRIMNDTKWMLKVHRQAKETEYEIESQVYREVIFLLESVDSTITHENAQQYRHKFNIAD